MSYPPLINDNREKVIIDDLTGDDWTRRNLSRPLLGRIDAAYERNQYTLAAQAEADGIADRIRIIPLPVEPMPRYFVFHRNSLQAKELLALYEKAVTDMKIDYDAMVRREIAKKKR